MYGIFYILGSLISSTIRSFKEQFEDFQSKQKTSDGYTYRDRYGIERLISNNHPISRRWNNETMMNDYVDLKTLKIIKSEMPTEIKRVQSESITRHKAKGRTAYIKKVKGFKMEQCRYQDIYKDLYTDDEYVIRRIRDRRYYVSIKTGKVIREIDFAHYKDDVDGIHEDEWDKVIDLRLLHDPNFPEVSI